MYGIPGISGKRGQDLMEDPAVDQRKACFPD